MMNCDQALTLMLEADLSDVSATAGTPLGEHLRGCAWCRRVGKQLVDDTRSLASAMALPEGRRSRWTRRVYEAAPMAVAAGILVVLTLQVKQQTAVDRGPTVLPTVVVNVPVPPPVAEISVPPAVKTLQTIVRVAPAAPARALPRPTPIAAVAMAIPIPTATPAPVVASNAVSVTPPADMRAVVMQTGDPKLVVVWLYDPEESR